MTPREKQREKQQRQSRKVRACKRLHKALPAIQDRIDRQLEYSSITCRKACAAAVSVMLQAMIRVGNEDSVQEHETFGITTLHTQHVTVSSNTIHFSFIGKAGVPWKRSITDPELAQVFSELLTNPLENRVFWYIENGERHLLTDADVRDWLSSFKVCPKDIRTYTANLLMYQELTDRQAQGLSKSAAKKLVSEVFEVVASHLGHLPSTCRANYVFPELWQEYVETGGQVTNLFT